MTFDEMFDAMIGFNEMEKSRQEIYLWGVRKQLAYAAWCAGNKDYKETDAFSLDLDEEARKERFKNMEPIKVTVDGKRE
jgi:hypothetical protein